MGINVETYQLSKKNGNGNVGSNADLSVLENRIENLENSLLTTSKEFKDDFKTTNNIDLDNTSAIINGDGVYIKFTDDVIEEKFENNLMIDYDRSENIEYDDVNKKLIVGKDSRFHDNAVFVSEEYECKDTCKAILNFDVTNGYTFTSEEVMSCNLASQNSIHYEEIDRYGRLWVLETSTEYSVFDENNTVYLYLTILNSDLTVYRNKKQLINLSEYFKKEIGKDGNFEEFITCVGISFTDENDAIISVYGDKYECGDCYVDLIGFLYDEKDNVLNRVIKIPSLRIINNSGFRTIASKAGKVLKLNNIYYIQFPKCGRGSYNTCNNSCGDAYVGAMIYDGIEDKFKYNLSSYLNEYNYGNGQDKFINSTSQMFIKNGFIYNIGYYNGLYYGGGNGTGKRNGDILRAEGNPTYLLNNSRQVRMYNIPFCIDRIDIYENSNKNTKTAYYSDNNWGAFNGNVLRNFFIRHYIESENLLLLGKDYTRNDKDMTTVVSLGLYSVDIDNINDANKRTLKKQVQVTMKYPTSVIDDDDRFLRDGYSPNVYVFDKMIHIFYLTTHGFKSNGLVHMVLDMELNVVMDTYILYASEEENKDIFEYCVNKINGEILVSFKLKDEDKIRFIKTKRVTTNFNFYYSTNKNLLWKKIDNNEKVVFKENIDSLKTKIEIFGSNSKIIPSINGYSIQVYKSDTNEKIVSELYTKSIPIIQSNGKMIFSPNQFEGDGRIDWYISFNGGDSYSPIAPNTEIQYSFMTAYNCKLRAILSAPNSYLKAPRIYDYTLKTQSSVLYSDMDELRMNLLKTNFKIDSYTFASKNGLYKMSIDTFNNNKGIDNEKSEFTADFISGYVCGKSVQSIPESIDENIKSLLLMVEEESIDDNNYIDYFYSIDGGENFIKIIPGVKVLINNVNTVKKSIVFRALFTGNSRLSSWGWAWE